MEELRKLFKDHPSMIITFAEAGYIVDLKALFAPVESEEGKI